LALVGRAGEGELAQAPQSHLDVAGAELDVAGEILELALVPNLHGTEVSIAILPDAHALGIIPIGTERRGAAGADPFAAALVALFLFGQALAQCFQKLVEAAERLDQFLLFFGEML